MSKIILFIGILLLITFKMGVEILILKNFITIIIVLLISYVIKYIHYSNNIRRDSKGILKNKTSLNLFIIKLTEIYFSLSYLITYFFINIVYYRNFIYVGNTKIDSSVYYIVHIILYIIIYIGIGFSKPIFIKLYSNFLKQREEKKHGDNLSIAFKGTIITLFIILNMLLSVI